MNDKNKYDDKVWQQILDCRAIGMTSAEIAEELNLGKNYVYGFESVLSNLRKKKFEDAVKAKENYHMPDETFEWIGMRLGISVEKLLVKKEEPAKPAKEEAKKAPPAAPAADYTLFFQKMLELQAQNNELLNQLMDVVIPRYTSDMKDNVNANCDVIGQSLKRMEDKMEAIKIGVRRKGM